MSVPSTGVETAMTRNKKSRFMGVAAIGVNILYQVYAQAAPAFTAEQAESGEAVYERVCARRHGAALRGGEFAPPLIGETFVRHWAGRSLGSFQSFIRTTMPPGDAGKLADSAYAEINAYILEAYGFQPGSNALPSDMGALDALLIPERDALEPAVRLGGNELSPGVKLPAWPANSNPLEHITSVNDALLESPPDGSWLSWRRTLDDDGFSPLKQITQDNVRSLRVAWTLALPPGPNETTPLVHDGVIFVQSYGDQVIAIDAATGDELWHYILDLPHGARLTVHRNIALYEDKLYLATSDARVIALRTSTGKLVWEQPIGEPSQGVATTGGPLVTRGVV
jgi:alcohol dehydrogenase (cytochrome c)